MKSSCQAFLCPWGMMQQEHLNYHFPNSVMIFFFNGSLSIQWGFPTAWFRLLYYYLQINPYAMGRRLFLTFPLSGRCKPRVDPCSSKQNTLRVSFKCFHSLPCGCFAAPSLSSIYVLCLKMWQTDTCLISSSLSWRLFMGRCSKRALRSGSSAAAGQLAQPLLVRKWEPCSFPGLSLQQLSPALKSLRIKNK